MPDVVSDTVAAFTEPIREVFVGTPSLSTFIAGYAFGALTFVVALIFVSVAHRGL